MTTDPAAVASGHADDCEMMVKLLTGWRCTCGYDPDATGDPEAE